MFHRYRVEFLVQWRLDTWQEETILSPGVYLQVDTTAAFGNSLVRERPGQIAAIGGLAEFWFLILPER
jgi:hypothetical protein